MSTEQFSEKYLGVVGMSGMSVRQGDTAIAHGSGDVPVLATPQVIALAESATIAALLESMEQGETSVGIRVEFDHVSTASIGAEVRAIATCTKVENNRLTFEIEVHEQERLIARGLEIRAVVDRVSFLAKAAAQSLSHQ